MSCPRDDKNKEGKPETEKRKSDGEGEKRKKYVLPSANQPIFCDTRVRVRLLLFIA